MIDEPGEWLTIADAAQRLGVSKQAIRSRILRKTVRVKPGKTQNDGLVRVFVANRDCQLKVVPAPSSAPITDAVPAPSTGSITAITPASQSDDGSDAALALIAELRAQIDALNARLIDQDCGHQADVDRLRADHRAEVERLMQIIDRLTTPRPGLLDWLKALLRR